MLTLAEVLDYFNDVDNDEVIRLYEQALDINSRMEGASSPTATTNWEARIKIEQSEHRLPMIWSDA